MGANIQVLIILGTIICFASISDAAEGTATFYKRPYFPSACPGYNYKDDHSDLAAASHAIWENGGACGKEYYVTCTGAKNLAPHPCRLSAIVVKIVDYCSGRGCGTINLSEEAFTYIADPNAGRIKIEYELW